MRFTSTQTLTTPSQGQARIESVPDNILNNLTTTIPGFDFTQAVFNLDAIADGSATINAFDQSGKEFSFSLLLSGSGQNFFTLTAVNGELISRVAFTSTVGLADVSQIRFGQTVAVPGPIVGAGLPGWCWLAPVSLGWHGGGGRFKPKIYPDTSRHFAFFPLGVTGRVRALVTFTRAFPRPGDDPEVRATRLAKFAPDLCAFPTMLMPRCR